MLSVDDYVYCTKIATAVLADGLFIGHGTREAHVAKTPYTYLGCPTWRIAMLKNALEKERNGFWGHLRRSAFRHA